MSFAFIGVGNMASAIINGMKDDAKIYLYDKFPGKAELFVGERFEIVSSCSEAVKKADFIVLSVKPQNFDEVLTEIKDSAQDLFGKTFISIAAGISISRIVSYLGSDSAVIRTMPNTPLMVGMGVTALTRNENVTDEKFESIVALFGSLGKTTVIDESDMNKIISATSSSPAYVYLFIKALYDGAVAQGLDPDTMLELICGAVCGSAEMVLKSGKTPTELIRAVTSPNGTTERALDVLYKGDFEKLIHDAMYACTKRADELSGI